MSDQTEGLGITSDPLPNGTYALVLSIDGDRSCTLTPDEAERYACAVFAVAAVGEYEQAVVAQMRALDLPDDAIALVLSGLRDARLAIISDDDTTPLTYVPGVNPAGEAFIRLDLDNKPIGQLTIDAARGHAWHMIEAAPAAALDAAYRSMLVKRIGITDRKAQSVVDNLSNYRPGGDET